MPWGDLVQPAIALAERGLSLDWYGAMSLLVEAKGLDRFEATRNVYLPGGRVPQPFEEGVPVFLKLGRLIDTLKKLASPDGPERFYRGDIAADLIRDLQAAGSKYRCADLERYQARFIDPVEIAYRDAQGLRAVRPDRRPDLEARADGVAEERLPARRRAGSGALCASMPRRSTAPIATGSQNMGASDSETRPKLHQPFLRRGQGRQRRRLDPDLAVALRLVRAVALDRHPDEQRHHVVRPGAGQAELDPPRRAAAQQHVPDGRAVAERSARSRIGASGGRKIMPSVAQILSFMLDFGMDLDARVPLPAHRRQRRRASR